jgi:hypothetical protein
MCNNVMKPATLLLLSCLLALAQKSDHPTGNRITPPTIRDVSPLGVSRGTTVEMTVEGFNLAKASGIYFSEPGIKGRIVRVKELPDLNEVRLGSNGTVSTIDLGPLPPRNQVTIELDIAPDAEIGVAKFRLLTPLGTSPEAQVLVEPYYGESGDREPNNAPETAVEAYLPTILAGAISRPGDEDYFKIQVKAGEELVFENAAMRIGSTLQPVVSILAEDGTVIKQYGLDSPTSAAVFSHKFDKEGTHYLRLTDYQMAGRASNFYRYKVGKFAVATEVYPLGLRKGASHEVSVTGPGLTTSFSVTGTFAQDSEDALVLRPATAAGKKAFNEVRLAIGEEPEVESAATNLSLAAAQPVSVPVTINGRIGAPGQVHHFRFPAKKGQKLVLEVNARRLGSDLDSEIEVLDASGKPIEHTTVRAIAETFTVLRDHDAVRPGIRIQSWNNLAVGDYLLIGSEVLRINALPRGPDDDFQPDQFGGQRIAYFGTSSEAHAIDKPIYKVQIHQPGAKFSANGLPLLRLQYRNDDGGPGFLKDSYLEFTAPADGNYIVRLRDVQSGGGSNHAYRLTVRPPKPDFRLAINPRNPNVPQGASIPLTVTAFRRDGFEDPIEVTLEGLPAGFQATKGIVGQGQVTATILLSAAATAKLEQAVPIQAIGRATIQGREVAHAANPEDKLKLLALMPRPDVVMTAQTKEVELEPGGTAEIAVTIARQGDFAGRVPVQVLNLPPRVRVLDVGLNGVLLNENESQRSFTIEALPSAEAVEQVIYVAATVETRSPQPAVYAAPQAIRLKVKPKSLAVDSRR